MLETPLHALQPFILRAARENPGQTKTHRVGPACADAKMRPLTLKSLHKCKKFGFQSVLGLHLVRELGILW